MTKYSNLSQKIPKLMNQFEQLDIKDEHKYLLQKRCLLAAEVVDLT